MKYYVSFDEKEGTFYAEVTRKGEESPLCTCKLVFDEDKEKVYPVLKNLEGLKAEERYLMGYMLSSHPVQVTFHEGTFSTPLKFDSKKIMPSPVRRPCGRRMDNPINNRRNHASRGWAEDD